MVRCTPADIATREVALHGDPIDDCEQCDSALALINITWQPADETFGAAHVCFRGSCVAWAVDTARGSTRDDGVITIEFERYLNRSPIALGAAA